MSSWPTGKSCRKEYTPMKKTAVIVEHRRGEINPLVHELLTFAHLIQAAESSGTTLFIIGDDIEQPAREISTQTGLDVRSVRVPGLSRYNGVAFNKILSRLLDPQAYAYICAPHSTSGMDYAPALSVSLGAGCITGVTGVRFEAGRTVFKRAMYGGKVTAEFIKTREPVVVTVQPGAFEPFVPPRVTPGRISRVEYPQQDREMRCTGARVSPGTGSGLDRADVVISGGRGIGEKENYRLIQAAAGLFRRGAAGASRPICDTGWASYDRQVGITGSTVSPRLYMACGISGAGQHTEGMKGAGLIVAVNIDPGAPIFHIADIGIVEDAVEFLRLFIEKVKSGQRRDGL